MTESDLTDRLDLAIDAARQAGRLTLEYFGRSGVDVEHKHDGSPVTIADRQAEALLRSRIEAAFPDDAVLGEEHGERPGTSGFRWILDPIDGTKSFVHAVPLYGTLVAVEHAGRGVVGVIGLPALDEMVYAATGRGAWYVRGNAAAAPARVSSVATLAEGLVCVTSVSGFAKVDRLDVYEALRARAGLSRGWGDCYGHVLVATGRAEAMVEPMLNVWDAAPMQPILEEAGGRYTDWQGRPTIYGGRGISTNGLVFDEVLALTHGR